MQGAPPPVTGGTFTGACPEVKQRLVRYGGTCPEVQTTGAMVQLLQPRRQHPLYRTMAAEVGKPSTNNGGGGGGVDRQSMGRTNYFTEQFRGGTRNDPLSKVFMPFDSTLTVGNRASRFASNFDENQLHATSLGARTRSFQRNHYGGDTIANFVSLT